MVRFTGEPIAAVFAAAKDEAEDLCDQVEIEITETPALIDGRSALVEGAHRWFMPEALGNVIVEGEITTPDFDEVCGSARTT